MSSRARNGPHTCRSTSSSRKAICTGRMMAVSVSENECINFAEMKFIDNMLYFIPESDENLESDYFGRLVPELTIIRNLESHVLLIDRRNSPVFEDMPDCNVADGAPQTTFNKYTYTDSCGRGMAIVISVMYGGNHTLSCENKTISFKKINPPDNINDTKSDIIFFQRGVPGHDDKIQFESSLYEGYFLACQEEEGFYKLILKKKDELEDTSVIFTIENKV